jgi:hypothetical protein
MNSLNVCNWIPMTDDDVDWLQGRGPAPGQR